MALQNGHLDVVNRLLDRKEIDINVQNKVSGMFNFVTSHLQILFPIFLDMFFVDFGDIL